MENLRPESLSDVTTPIASSNWRARLVSGVLLVVAFATLYLTNAILTERFTQSTANRAELRLALYGSNLQSELQRNSIVPQLLARDPSLISALNSNDFTQTSQRLISFVDEIGAASLSLLDRDGRTVASTERVNISKSHREKGYFIDAVRSANTVFRVVEKETGGFGFYYSRRVDDQGQVIGVILVEVDLQKFERAWAGISEAVFVTNSEGIITLSTEPKWRGMSEDQAIALQSPESALDRALRMTTDWGDSPFNAYVAGQAVMRIQGRIPFRGWQITTFTAYSSVRERVNAILAFEIMIFAVLFAVGFYYTSRRNASKVIFFQRESLALRDLNARLHREIAERERMEKTLQVAEQSLAQSSKLAALGEMAAAVSHELNQPLAAMKTYLAGAGLLLRRNRPDEAMVAFQRMDDLVERMGAITRQLKSHARKGAEKFSPIDIAAALDSSISMMDPQFRLSKIKLTKILPDEDVFVMGDRMRLEQVLINLLRNAHDAVKNETHPEIEIILNRGNVVTLSVRDNGHGISDLENLFEPFQTTKAPGDGVGLGLAISSGIIKDLGGRLTARNAENGGAVFVIEMPIFNQHGISENPIEAAE
ncbi:MAG: sensor histidine kinase [Rhodobacteraceae bacterium]|nr:sensor histidine kinase [Paracoccaceae bacterium]